MGLPPAPPRTARFGQTPPTFAPTGPAPQTIEEARVALGMPSLPGAPTAPQLPQPPTAQAKRPTIWDKDHISETLARIGSGFLSGHNFGDGLGAASQAIAGRTRDLRTERTKSVTYGGPDDQFEISTDSYGNRSVREVPEFAKAVREARDAKNRPDPTKAADLRARALYAIATQVPPEKRAQAYRDLVTNPDAYGIDANGLPAEWSDDFGTIGGMMGLDVNQSLTQERSNVLARDLIRHRGVQEVQGAQKVQQGAAKVAQGAQRVAQGAERLRKSPPSTRKGSGAKLHATNSDLDYLTN